MKKALQEAEKTWLGRHSVSTLNPGDGMLTEHQKAYRVILNQSTSIQPQGLVP